MSSEATLPPFCDVHPDLWVPCPECPPTEVDPVAAYRADLIRQVEAEDEAAVLYEDGAPVAKFAGLISKAAVLRLLTDGAEPPEDAR